MHRRGLRHKALLLLSRLLSGPRAPVVMIVLSALILSLSLDTGFSADDYVHSAMLDGAKKVPGFAGRAPWDLFRFTTPETTPLLREEGVLCWWDDPRGRLAFFRPVSSLTHALDHVLFPKSAAMQHLHSVLWSVLAFAGIWALYRQLLPAGVLLGLSIFMYVLDDARAWFSSWIAGRNTVIATALSVWVLVFHVAYRRTGDRRAQALAIALFPIALLGGEGSIAVGAYMLAYALFLERDKPLFKTLLPLVPYGVVVVLWRVVYKRLGYGAAHSYLYTDPGAEPLVYLMRLLERGPVLWLAQLGGPWSDNWSSFFVFPTFKAALYVVAVLSLFVAAALLWPLIKREPVLRFCAMGAVLSTLPATAAFPADRLLNWIAIGASPLLAYLLAALLQQPAAGSLGNRFRALAGGYLFVVHMIVGPLIMCSRARGNEALQDVLNRCDDGVPKDPSITEREVFYINSPAVPLGAYTPIMRAQEGEPMAKRQMVLNVATVPLTVRRVGERSLEMESALSLFWNPGSQLLIGPDTRFAKGDKRTVVDTTVTVLSVDDRDAPLRIRYDFAKPLEDSGYLFLRWAETTYAPFTLPAVGEEVVLPQADYLQVLLGQKLFIEAKYPVDRL